MTDETTVPAVETPEPVIIDPAPVSPDVSFTGGSGTGETGTAVLTNGFVTDVQTPVEPEAPVPVFDTPVETPEPVDTAPVEATPAPLDSTGDSSEPVTPKSEIELLESDFIKKFREVESFTADTLSELFHWTKTELSKL